MGIDAWETFFYDASCDIESSGEGAAELYCTVVQLSAPRVAERHLTLRGFRFYNPLISKSNSTGQSVGQLFPGYMFVWIVDRWRQLRSTPGIRDLLYVHNPVGEAIPARVPDHVVDRLIASQDDRGLVVLEERRRFELGQKVQVASGPLALEYGLYDGQRDRDRVFVLMNLLGQVCRTEVREDNLVAA